MIRQLRIQLRVWWRIYIRSWFLPTVVNVGTIVAFVFFWRWLIPGFAVYLSLATFGLVLFLSTRSGIRWSWKYAFLLRHDPSIMFLPFAGITLLLIGIYIIHCKDFGAPQSVFSFTEEFERYVNLARYGYLRTTKTILYQAGAYGNPAQSVWWCVVTWQSMIAFLLWTFAFAIYLLRRDFSGMVERAKIRYRERTEGAENLPDQPAGTTPGAAGIAPAQAPLSRDRPLTYGDFTRAQFWNELLFELGGGAINLFAHLVRR
ncbi:MAG: hypothetical protein G01um101433_51 [Parcubacteria group bacterium Gr01-1014_33]|nr:MAG: hypothetical protein G01um101433_51 [Parcubacteria group bacterium Gr01-1014_33]